MHPLLTNIGIPDEIQAFFDIQELCFFYGSSASAEIMADGFHFVPSTGYLWIWNPLTAGHVVITHSVMEAIAFLSCNIHRYPDLRNIAFVALGCLPGLKQLADIRERFPLSKFILAFANDLPGHLMDIYVAAALRKHSLRLVFLGDYIEILCNGRTRRFEADRLTLNVFQKSLGIRTSCRTIKPKRDTTFLTQMFQQSSEI